MSRVKTDSDAIHITKSDEPRLAKKKFRETMCGIVVSRDLVVKDPHAQPVHDRGCEDCYIAYRRLPFSMIGTYRAR